jgi:hypothetical protein
MTQRGNNRQDVFFVDDDRRLYLRILAEECQAHGNRGQSPIFASAR